MLRIKFGLVEKIIALGKAVLGNDVCSHTGEGMGHYCWLSRALVLGQPGAQFIYDRLDQRWLQTSNRLFGKERVPGFAALPVLVMIQCIESRDVLLAKHAHLGMAQHADCESIARHNLPTNTTCLSWLYLTQHRVHHKIPGHEYELRKDLFG